MSPRARALLSVAALLLAAGCGLPTRAIPTERVDFASRTFVFGSDEVEPDGAREDVVEIRRAGPREDASILLRVREGVLTAEVLETGRVVARAPDPGDLDEAAALIKPANPSYARGLRPWLAERTDVALLERLLAAETRARRGANAGLFGALVDAFRTERASIEAAERDERERNTVFLGVCGWQRGAYSGWSWSPFHLERYDKSDDERGLFLFPLVSGGRSAHEGWEGVAFPLLSYAGRTTTPVERSGGLIILGCGAHTRYSAEGREMTTLALPLLFARRTSEGEDVGASGGRLEAGRRASTHVLASLVAWSSETPGVYRDQGALKIVGRERSSFRVLPLISHDDDERSSETMLWPLLGFGWGSDEGRGYVRLFYFWKIGGR